MAMMSPQEIYERHIKLLAPAERLRLVELIAHDMVENRAETRSSRSLLELEGLGAEIWQGIDAQSYVDELRDEWDERRW